MERLLKELKAISRQLDKLIWYVKDDTRQTSKSYIDGTLIEKKARGKTAYYRNIGKEAPLQYISPSNTALLAPLAQKRYDKQVLKTATERKQLVDGFIKELEKLKDLDDLPHIYKDLQPELKALVKPHMDDDEAFVQHWMSKNVGHNTMKNKTGNYTQKGEQVRSKSEILIADRLYAKGVPYHYEPVFDPTEEHAQLSPDFLILNVKTRKNYVWEHLGRMDDPDYCANNLWKLEQYANAGFIQGVNMIVTHESSEYPLSTRLVDQIIEANFK